MSVPGWVAQHAAAFWAMAGGPEPFPRALRGPINRSPLDLTIQELPGLRVRTVEHYLAGLGAPWACGGADRPLCGCLAAWNGAGFIFLDAADPPAERTAALAHELAHFLRHYLEPRQRACRRLGGDIAAVLDGRRPPTAAERLRSLLTQVSIDFHVHLMHRDERRAVVRRSVLIAEEEADRLAYELLAPADAVLARAQACDGRVEAVLQAGFGLAAAWAADYARLLRPPERPADPLLRLWEGGRTRPY